MSVLREDGSNREDFRLGVGGVLHDSHDHLENKQHRGSRPHLVSKVSQAAVTLRGSVELGYLGDVEAAHELLPDGLAQTVAQRHAHPMFFLHVPDRLVQQVSADLTDVLHNLEQKENEEFRVTGQS